VDSVLVITPWYAPSWNSGGTPLAAYNISKLYEAEGYDVTVLTTTENGNERLTISFHSFSLNHHCYYFSFPRIMKGAGLSFDLALKFIKSYRNHDIIHLHGVRNLYAVIFVVLSFCAANKKKFILTPHAGLMKDWISQSPYYQLIKLYSYISAKFMTSVNIHYLSEAERDESTSILRKKSFILPNYVEIENVNIRNNFNNKFLMVGRIHPQKNFESAFRFIKNNNIECLDIYGPVDDEIYFDRLLKLREELELTDRVNFKGNLDNRKLLDKYNLYSALIVSSKVEGISMAMIEAMGCGVPVLFSKGVANKDLLVKYFPNLFVNDWDNNVESVKSLTQGYSEYTSETRRFFEVNYSRESVHYIFRDILKGL
jgi:glycosyltransferase involved in cell wall biosynthesis